LYADTQRRGDRIELSAQLRLVIQLGLMAAVIVSGGGGAAPGGRQYLLWVGFRTVLGVLAGWFGAFWVESCRLRKSVRAKIAAE
jgi:hypothetical protein